MLLEFSFLGSIFSAVGILMGQVSLIETCPVFLGTCPVFLDKLIQTDVYLTLAVNSWHASWADGFMSLMSKMWIWVPLYIFLLLSLLTKEYRKVGWLVVLGLVLLVGAVDWTSVHFFKDVFMRLRPSHDPTLEGLIRIPYDKGGLYGFISSHASNHFAIAVYVSFFLKYRYKLIRWGILYVWAALICYSRVYLGRHFVGDVLVGALWGIFLGLLFAWIIRLLLSRYYPSVRQDLFR